MRYQLRYVRLSSQPGGAAMAGQLYPNPDVPSKPVRRLPFAMRTGSGRVWTLREPAYPSIKAGLTEPSPSSAMLRVQPGHCHPHCIPTSCC